jgi:hypothetical protein
MKTIQLRLKFAAVPLRLGGVSTASKLVPQGSTTQYKENQAKPVPNSRLFSSSAQFSVRKRYREDIDTMAKGKTFELKTPKGTRDCEMHHFGMFSADLSRGWEGYGRSRQDLLHHHIGF